MMRKSTCWSGSALLPTASSLVAAGLLCSLAGTSAAWGRAPALAEGADLAAWEALGLEVSPGDHGLEGEDADGRHPGIGDGAVVPVTVITMDGDSPPGAGGQLVLSINPPVMDGLGRVGMTGSFASDNYVFYDGGVIFLNSSVAMPSLSGGESSMGVADDGSFFFSPSIDGSDGVWSDNGQVAVEETQAPGFPMGTISTFHSRPSMIPTGQVYWVAGFNESGGTSSEGRMLYTSPTASAGDIAVVLRADDMVGGFTIARGSGIGFDYDFSNDGNHHIQELGVVGVTGGDDDAVYVDGAIVAREGQPLLDGGGNWDNFDQMAINNNGNYLFGGDTDGPTAVDEFIAYNGAIAVREGETVGGVALVTSAAVRGLALNDNDQAVHAWSANGLEVLFAACDASNLGDASLLLAVGDQVDIDGDSMADAMVVDFETSNIAGAGLALSNGGVVAIEVELDDGMELSEAMITLDTGCVDTVFADGFESGDTSAWSMTIP